jgi:hypothetical protein
MLAHCLSGLLAGGLQAPAAASTPKQEKQLALKKVQQNISP